MGTKNNNFFILIKLIKVPRRKQRGITEKTPLQSRGKPRGIEPFLAPRLACPLPAKDRLAYVANKYAVSMKALGVDVKREKE
jgi:hypothetical protein